MEQWTGSKLGKEHVKAIYCHSPCLFNLYAQYIMQNARLDESQGGIKIAGRNISNPRYADDTTLWQEVKRNYSLLMKVKEENEKACLRLSTQKTKIMASDPITSWQTEGEKMETVEKMENKIKQILFSWAPKSLWTARRSSQSILKEINPDYSLKTNAEDEAPLLWSSDMTS